MSPDKKIVIIAGPNGARARRRLRNFHRVYKPLADVWLHFDNAGDEAEPIDWSEKMTTKTNTPLSEARDADARNTVVALQRAAKRARELAAQTATPLVVVHRGQPTQPKQPSKT